MSNEEFGSYFTALIMLIDPISHITTNYNELKQGQASLRRLNEITNKPIEILKYCNAKLLIILRLIM